MKLKKELTLNELKRLYHQGAIIDRDCTLDTFGTSGMGYIERRGIRINGVPYQVVYSSKGYGKITSNLKEYNGRFLPKYVEYVNDVRANFYEHFMPYIYGSRLLLKLTVQG